MDDYEIFSFYETRKMTKNVDKRRLLPQFNSMAGTPTGPSQGARLNDCNILSNAQHLNSDPIPLLSTAIIRISANSKGRKAKHGNE